MKHFLVINALILSFFAFSQEYSFIPKWKVGDKKTISISTRDIITPNNRFESSDTTIFEKITISILKEDSDFYTIEVNYDNPVVSIFIYELPSITKKLNPYSQIKFTYTLNKKTKQIQVQNWQEIQTKVFKQRDKVQSIVLKESKELNQQLLNMIFIPIKMMFNSEKMTNLYFKNILGFLTLPFEREYIKGEEVRFNENLSSGIYSLVSIDKKNAVIIENIKVDLTPPFIAKTLKTVDFNYKSTWVTKSITKNISVIPKGDSTKKQEKIITAIVE